MVVLFVLISGTLCLFVLSLLRPLVEEVRKGNLSTLGKRIQHRFVRRINGLRYLLAGPHIIDHEYSRAGGKPFTIPTPSNDHLMITSTELIKELMSAPHQTLSLHAVAKEMLQPKFTMYGFEWQDQRGVEGTGFVRALRSLLTSHLPQFQPDLDRIIRLALEDELKTTGSDGFARAQLFPMIKRIVTRVNCFVFFGEELSNNGEFTEAALELPQTIIQTAELLRVSPAFLRPLVTAIATRRHRASRILFRYLEPVVKERLAKRCAADQHAAKQDVPADCMQWLIDTSPRKDPWSPSRMIGEIMAIWFSSVHQLAMTATFVVEDLCLHREYMEPLRQEVESFAPEGSVHTARLDVSKLTLLDSFVKESIRCSNADAISCRRKALQTYVFRDGSRVEKDDWVCIPQRAMMRDAQRYSDPDKFDGFRFANANGLLRLGQTTDKVPDKDPSTITTATVEWPIWGLGNTACPGRFYASLVMKLLVTQILTEWECETPDTTQRHMIWRSSIVPREGTVGLFRKRASSQ
ncbi:cytochrome P450 [Sodiomyces alkalinus F11]|uniref:Cytochrome P450 n=1 Tax=Sodiomyces alkalinus (strain CBS 110278 / VKM F-3762 / F11) TaxID=1314773 RepID=A0A3N2Q807_SODAK|nr:cytochrome P450 [Sodiomyces alkalinus F11]ROT42882.1 cytochrome P450 [Sodiomyces alkalinus F11]